MDFKRLARKELSPIEHARKHWPQFTEQELQAALKAHPPRPMEDTYNELADLAAQLAARTAPAPVRLSR